MPNSVAVARATPFINPGVAVQRWYVAAPSTAVRRGRAVTVDWLGRRLALFRGEDGRVQGLEARCPHLGADLGRETVVGDRQRGGFHHWVFDRSGICRAIPLPGEIPSSAGAGAP